MFSGVPHTSSVTSSANDALESELSLAKVNFSMLLLYLIFHKSGSRANKKMRPEGESPWATPTKIRKISERPSEVYIPAILPFSMVLKIFIL